MIPEQPVRRHRWSVPLAAGIVVIILVGGAAIWAWRPDRSRPAQRAPAFSTTAVAKGTVQQEKVVLGTLKLAGQRTLASTRAGVITWLPAVGTRLRFGSPLYSVDDQSVMLLPGPVPAWRGFEPGMPAGPDILQLEVALRSMGYFVATANHSFGAATTAAIKRWQFAQGRPRTGIIPAGTIVFGEREPEVAGRPVPLGAHVAQDAAVLTVSTGRMVVRAAVKLDDERLARPGVKVTVSLPDGTSTTGTVTRVGTATEQRQGTGQPTVVVPTTIALRGQKRAARLRRAPVSVRFVSARHRNVLTVPVEALVALDDTTFAVEVPAGGGALRRVPVRTGLFSAGRVQISGAGIRPGLPVVVPGP